MRSALIIDALAPSFRSQRNFPNALKLSVYSFTPVWLAGIFILIPGLRFLTILGLYGLYLMWTGMTPLMGSPRDKSLLYAFCVAGRGDRRHDRACHRARNDFRDPASLLTVAAAISPASSGIIDARIPDAGISCACRLSALRPKWSTARLVWLSASSRRRQCWRSACRRRRRALSCTPRRFSRPARRRRRISIIAMSIGGWSRGLASRA